MIFQLQCHVDELVNAGGHEIEPLFTKLLDADREGRHFVVLQRRLCDWATNNLKLSGQNLAHLNRIRQEYTSRGDMLNVSLAMVSVVIGNQTIEFDGARTFLVGHKTLIRGKFLNVETSFVVENVNSDGQFYDCALRATQRMIGGPSINYDFVPGGGSTSDKTFEEEIGKQKVVVCVVDQDRSTPKDRRSSLVKRVEKIDDRKISDGTSVDNCFIGSGITTVGREVENYIPYSALREMKQFRRHSGVVTLDKLVNQTGTISSDECLWLYFDVKKGMDGKALIDEFDQGKLSADAIGWICNKFGCKFEDLERQKVDGFGDDVLKVFLLDNVAQKLFHSFIRSEYWGSLFGDFFANLLWFFAAPNPVRI